VPKNPLSDRFHYYVACLCFGALHASILEVSAIYLQTGLALGILILCAPLSDRKRFIGIGVCLFLGFWLRLGQRLAVLESNPPIESRTGVLYGQVMGLRSGAIVLDVFRSQSLGNPMESEWFSVLVVLQNPPAIGQNIRVILDSSSLSFHRGLWRVRVIGSSWSEHVLPLYGLDGVRKSSNMLRLKILSVMDTILEGFPLFLGFLQMSLLQERSNFGLPLSEVFRELGLSHVLVTSGFHVTILALALSFCLKHLVLVKEWRWPFFITGLLAYGLVCGYSVSIFRAIVFALLMGSGREMGATARPVRLLLILLVVHVSIWPEEILAPGFHLSYGITWFLLIMPDLPATWNTVIREMVTGFVLQILALPYLMYVFGKWSIVSLIGVILLPLMPVMLMAGLLSVMTGFFVTVLGRILGVGVGYPAEMILGWISSLPVEDVNWGVIDARISLPLLLLVYFTVLVWLLWPRKARISRSAILNFGRFCNGLEQFRPKQIFVELNQLIHPPENDSAWIKTYCIQARAVLGKSIVPFLILGPIQLRFCMITEKKFFRQLRALALSYPSKLPLANLDNPFLAHFFLNPEPLIYDSLRIRHLCQFLLMNRNSAEWSMFFVYTQQKGYPWNELFACLPDLLTLERQYWQIMDRDQVSVDLFQERRFDLNEYFLQENRLLTRWEKRRESRE